MIREAEGRSGGGEVEKIRKTDAGGREALAAREPQGLHAAAAVGAVRKFGREVCGRR